MTEDPRTAVRRLRKHVRALSLARRREGGPFPGHSRGLRRAQDLGAQAHRLQRRCRRAPRPPLLPTGLPAHHSRGLALHSKCLGSGGHARPQCPGQPQDRRTRATPGPGSGQLPGVGVLQEDSHWGTRNLAAGPPPRPPAPRPLRNRGLCDQVPPVEPADRSLWGPRV